MTLLNFVISTRFFKPSTTGGENNYINLVTKPLRRKTLPKKQHRLEDENKNLKQIIYDLTIALKKANIDNETEEILIGCKKKCLCPRWFENSKGHPPFWGYRGCWAYIYYRQGMNINKRLIYRPMKENNLLGTKINKYKAKRKAFCSKTKAYYHNQK